jgi:hypothetical protein
MPFVSPFEAYLFDNSSTVSFWAYEDCWYSHRYAGHCAMNSFRDYQCGLSSISFDHAFSERQANLGRRLHDAVADRFQFQPVVLPERTSERVFVCLNQIN